MENLIQENKSEKLFQKKLEQFFEIQKIIKTLFKENIHFTKIEGSEKLCLLKAGAELLSELYDFYPTFEILKEIENWEDGFFYYMFKCTLFSRNSSQKISEGYGSYNSKKQKIIKKIKFVPENELLTQEKENIENLEVKEIFSKNNKPYKLYKVEREEIFSDANAILKMAEKSAFIDAILKASMLSNIFTQDLEDSFEKHSSTEKYLSNLDSLIQEANNLIHEMGINYWISWKNKRKLKVARLKDLQEDEIKDLIAFLQHSKQKGEKEVPDDN
ncbi:MAG: hypothetical protein NC833_03320 [Candidatus Omnitrophica bacterium]|nr:hypothetical protein [Candidatus Omnitrophota bacterium]